MIGPLPALQPQLDLASVAREMMETVTQSPSLGAHGVGFAGGGGSSEAYKIAGFIVHAAVNHDVEAVAMHRMNHREAYHHRGDIRRAKWTEIARGRKFRSMWFSPDCRDFSKAKQGKPKSKRVRGLAWEVIRAVLDLGPLAPDVIFLENVEEFAQWCTLLPNGKRNPWRLAWLFLCFTGALYRRGYTEIQWAPGDGFVYRRTWAGVERVPDVVNSGRARDYGAPTIRKRLFLVARRDGKPVVWPEPTHGAPDSEGVKAGRLRPWRTFADIAQWEQPCPSIFMTRRQARAFTRRTGLRIQRPLARASQRRIAVGVGRHVLEAAEPFLAVISHGEESKRTGAKRWGRLDRSIHDPLGAVTGSNDYAVISPILATLNHGGGKDHAPRPVNEPLRTLTAAHDAHTLVSAFLAYGQHGGATRPADGQVQTIAASSKDTNQVAVVSLAKLRGSPEDHPPGGPVTEPLSTISAGGQHHGVFAAFVAQNNGGAKGNQSYGHRCDEPVSTIAGKGSNQSFVAVSIATYYGADQDTRAGESLPTVTTRDRFALTLSELALPPLTPELAVKARRVARFLRRHGVKVEGEFATVTVAGVELVIVDIGMRMLTPRELYRAQGFSDDYVIDCGIFELPDGSLVERRLTNKAQVRMCGNSVSPLHAAAIIRANLHEPAAERIAA